MAQHFLLSAAARTLSLGAVARMLDEEVERVFIRLRWSDSDGQPYCPHCRCTTVYMARRPSGAARWRCKACRKDFSVTSGTLFAFHKMPLRSYLMAIAIFANEVKGKSMLALSRDLGTQYKTAFVLAHKIREAMASEVRQTPVGGEGKKAEIDGGYFGGHVKPANKRENRRDRRLRENRSGKRKVVVVIRERGENGRTVPGVFRSEVEALNFIRRQVPQGTTLYGDSAGPWNELVSRYTLHRINHDESYSLGGDDEIHTNAAESFFSRMRRGEIGHHHHVAGPYLIRFAQEAAWRGIILQSSQYARLQKQVMFAFSSKYALALYEMVQKRGNLKFKASEEFPVDTFHGMLGVEPGKLTQFKSLKQRAIDPAVLEVNGLGEFGCKVEPIYTGRKVTAVRLSWWSKNLDERINAMNELRFSRVGRRARLKGEVVTAMPSLALNPSQDVAVARGGKSGGRSAHPNLLPLEGKRGLKRQGRQGTHPKTLLSGNESGLTERQFERFRRQFPGLDIAYLEREFRDWVDGRDPPQDYAAAFYGFMRHKQHEQNS
jgi:transposase-like protein